jgi:hypothetical protein
VADVLGAEDIMIIKLAEMRVVSSDEMPMAILFTAEELQYIKGLSAADDILCSVPSSWTQQQGQAWIAKRQPELSKVREKLAQKAQPPKPEKATPAAPEAKPPPGVPAGSTLVMTDKQMADWAEAALKSGPALQAGKRPAQTELKATFEVVKTETEGAK